MDILGYYIFNSTRGLWLQDDEKSWGNFSSAVEFNNLGVCQQIRERESGDDVTYTMAAM